MKLITKEIEAKLLRSPLGSQSNNPNPPIIVKFFTPDSNFTWYVTEGEKQSDGEWRFFGLVGFELGYFSLAELESSRGRLKLPVERDMYFDGKFLKDVMK